MGSLPFTGHATGPRHSIRPPAWSARAPAQGRTFGQGVVLSDGTLVVPYSVLTKATDQQRSLRVQRSDTGGESFLGEQFLRDYQPAAPVQVAGLRSRSWRLTRRAGPSRTACTWSGPSEPRPGCGSC